MPLSQVQYIPECKMAALKNRHFVPGIKVSFSIIKQWCVSIVGSKLTNSFKTAIDNSLIGSNL